MRSTDIDRNRKIQWHGYYMRRDVLIIEVLREK